MNPLISIIVPIYNVEQYIMRCVDSILAQTYSNIEVILVNDGSKDKSGEIADAYCDQFPKKVRVIHKDNGGLGSARNAGLLLVKGELVTFVDGDDYIENSHIETLYKELEKNSADVVFGGYKKINNHQQTVVQNILAGNIYDKNNAIRCIIPRMCGTELDLNNGMAMSVCMNLYNVEIIRNNKMQFVSEREYISEDFVFNIEFLQYISVAYCSDSCGYCYVFNDRSLTHIYKKERFEKQKIMTTAVINKTRELGIYDLCEQRIINTFLSWTKFCIKAEQRQWRCSGIYKSYMNVKKICSDDVVRWAYNNKVKKSSSFLTNMMDFLIANNLAILIWLLVAIKNLKSE